MVIALHNIAVEHEYLKQFQHSLTHYKKAKDFAQSALGAEHIMSKKMEMVFQQAAIKVFTFCKLIVDIDFRFTREANDKKE